MSASLPRIKSIQDIATQPSVDGLQKLKFRKLNLQAAENGEERKPSLKVLKTERLKSLQRYSTVQQQREYKNEKIHLNLIQRKLLNGTYDEKKQTSNELNMLKQKRDNIKVETASKQREIERIKILLYDIKKEIQEFNSKKGEHDIKLKQIKDKHQIQIQKTETARQTRSVLENMIKLRHEINMVLSKRSNQLKQQVGFLNSALTLIDTELREASQKCAIQQTKLEQLQLITQKEREERNIHISQHQEKIVKRREGQVFQAEKSKQYIAFLQEVERKSQIKDFKSIYDKILANLFVSRYCKKLTLELAQKYEPYEHSYSLISSYQTFDPSNPKTLVTRYLQQQPQKVKHMATIQQKEKQLASLETKHQNLKQIQMELMNDEMFTQQNLQIINKSGLMKNDKSSLSILKETALELEEKTLKIKNSILRMLKDLNQKGDRRISNGNQITVYNMTLLSNILKQLIKD